MRGIIEGFLFFVIPLLAIPCLLLYLLFGIGTFWIPLMISEYVPPVPWISMILPLIFIYGILPILALSFICFNLLGIFRKLQKKEKILQTKKPLKFIYYILIVLLSILIVGFVAMIALSLMNEENNPPHLFPLDDKEATYIISKKAEIYYLIYDSKSTRNSSFECSYSGRKATCGRVIRDNIEIPVGKVGVAVESLLGKNLQLKGDFAFGDQCIIDKCVHVIGIVLNISSVQEAK